MKPFWALIILLGWPAAGAAPPPGTNGTVETLTGLLAMPREEAARALPLKIRGVVSWLNPGSGFFLTEGPAATYVSLGPGVAEGTLANPQPGIEAGAMVEIAGITSAGAYAPMIGARRIHRIGTAPAPVPRRVDLDFLTGGREDC